MDLLSSCLDWTNMGTAGLSANGLCARLSSGTGPCVSLKAFTEHEHAAPPAPQQTAVAQVTAPCKRNPCGPGSVCLVNRGCRIGHACKPYRCVAGCKVGELSHYLVPEDSYARVPTFNGQKGCVKVCLCTKKGIEKCLQVPCSPVQPCWLAGKQVGKSLRARAQLVSQTGKSVYGSGRVAVEDYIIDGTKGMGGGGGGRGDDDPKYVAFIRVQTFDVSNTFFRRNSRAATGSSQLSRRSVHSVFGNFR